LETVQLGGYAFVAGTTVRGCFALRACVVNPRSAERDIDRLVAAIREAGVRLLADTGRA
jgi:hypothetical protein